MIDMRATIKEAFRSDEDMTDKARRYMVWVGLYCLAMAFVCVFRTDTLGGPSFTAIRDSQRFGMQGWGWVHLVVGLTALGAARYRLPVLATLGLMGVAGCALPFAVGFGLSYATVPHSSPTGVIIYGVWAVVNIDQSRNPLTAPMERVIRKLAVNAT